MAQASSSHPDREIVQGPIPLAVWRIAWPTMLTNLFAGLQGMVDHAMVGHYVGYLGNAAIGVSWQIYIVVIIFVSSLYSGMAILVSRFSGAGDTRKVDRVVYQVGLVSVALGVGVFAPVGWTLAPELLELVNARPEVQAEALPYLRTLFLYCLGSLVFFMLGGALRAAGDARTPMRLGILMTSLNMALTVVLVPGVGFIPPMGTYGAGIATVTAGGVAAVVEIWLLASGRLVVRFAPGSSWKPNWKVIRALFYFGLPTGFQAIALNLGALFLIRYVGALEASAEAQAAFSVAYVQLFSLVQWAGSAVLVASSTVAGQNLGAQKPDRAARAPFASSLVGLGIAAPLGLVFVLAPRVLFSIFGIDHSVVLALGGELLGFLSVAGVFLIIALCYTGALQGMGDTRNPLYIALISQLVVPLGLCAVLDHTAGLTPTGIWLALLLAHVTRCVLSVYCFRRGRWRHIELQVELSSHSGIPRPSPWDLHVAAISSHPSAVTEHRDSRPFRTTPATEWSSSSRPRRTSAIIDPAIALPGEHEHPDNGGEE